MKVLSRTRISGERLATGLLGLSLVAAAGCGAPQSPPNPAPNKAAVHVAPPTGHQETDRASILAALEEVRIGGTIQFAPGTYLVGELIRVTTSDITLLGHPDGTILRGCHPGDFVEVTIAGFACNGLELAGGRQSVRNLTFEYAWHGLFIGCCFPADMAEMQSADGPPHRHEQPGGHLIEGNTFRNSSNGMRVVGRSAEPIIIRGNRFINAFHALVINGGTAHFLDNDISTPDPAAIPIQGRNGGAIIVMPDPPVWECGENIIAGNRIVDYADAIQIYVPQPGARCERNVVRENTVVVRRNPLGGRREAITMGSPSDTTVVGIPLSITNRVATEGSSGIPVIEGAAVVGGHRIEGNRIIGADGIGIEIRGSSGNQIVDNHLSGIKERDPFPGNTTHSMDPDAWRDANGSGIWISPGSDENEVVGNTFEDMAGYSVVLEGNRNRVERQRQDAVRDLGTGNRVSVPAHGETRVLEVDGYDVHVYTGGWQHLDSGRPVVVFEGFSSSAWEGLPAMLAEETTVVAYERAGHGLSEWDGQPPTPEHMNDRLQRVLEVLGAPPPYTLVGHSIGGPLVVSFARRYSDRVAGLVLVDPTPPLSDWLASFDDIGVGPAGHEEFVETGRRMVETLPPGLRAEQELFMRRMGDFASLDTPLGGPPVPVTVLLAGAGYEIPPELPSTFDIDEQHEALLLRQIARYSVWTRTMPDATIVVANNSRHCIHCWDPDLVAWAIRRVLGAHR
jgi:parallel beta-helix repeat protein